MRITSDPLGEKTVEMVAGRFRVLGDPLRLRLLGMISEREMSVGEIVEAARLPQASVSKQLQILLKAALVSRRKEGHFVYYSLADPSVMRLCDVVCGSLAAQLQKDLAALKAISPPAKRPSRRRGN